VLPVKIDMKIKAAPPFHVQSFLERVDSQSLANYQPKGIIFSQGESADAVFYICKGKLKLSVVSKQGKEATIALLGPGQFCGEGCITNEPIRITGATAITECCLIRIEKRAMLRLLHEEQKFADLFMAYLLTRTTRYMEDLVDQLFNSSEKRLARVLLLLANFGKEGKPEPVIPEISQEDLAEMVGTTRSRVNFFMNKFRKLGFIKYNGGLHVHNSLLNIVLRDK